jgi:hypothetical protein
MLHRVTETPAAPRFPRGIGALYALAAAASLSMAVLPLLGLPCERCTGGALSLALPWIGGGVYAALALLARVRPGAALLGHAASFTVFVHADLMGESAALGRLCWGCMAVAACVLAAGAWRAAAVPAERLPLAAGLLLGAAASLVSPYDRVDYALTRRLWPARLLADLPAIVPRERVFQCDHTKPAVRLLVYEKDCKVCGSATRRLLPGLDREFGDRLCVHVQEVAAPPPGTRLPVFVMATPDRRLLALEGSPSPEELREMLTSLLENRPYRLEAAGR